MSTDYLRQIQDDAEQRLLATPYFADVAILVQRKFYTKAEAERFLGALKGKSGKVGAAVVVLMPDVRVPSPDTPGPHYIVGLGFQVLEHPTINASSIGTRKGAEAIALQVLQLFHHFAAIGFTQCLTASQSAIVPDDSVEGHVGYLVSFETRGGLVKPAKVSTPSLSPSSGAAGVSVTVTCATAGATIFVTTDGSYPSSTNGAAFPYVAPVEAPAGVLRAAAELADYLPSDVNAAKFT